MFLFFQVLLQVVKVEKEKMTVIILWTKYGIQEPVNIDIQQNTNQSQSAGFCSTIAYKLDALSEDARDRAMIRIFEVLREERHRDQA